jgi:hypothetical protein
MADEQPLPIQFEDVPLNEARRMSRGPRMEPMLYDTLRQKIQSLSSEAVRIHLGPGHSPYACAVPTSAASSSTASPISASTSALEIGVHVGRVR